MFSTKPSSVLQVMAKAFCIGNDVAVVPIVVTAGTKYYITLPTASLGHKENPLVSIEDRKKSLVGPRFPKPFVARSIRVGGTKYQAVAATTGTTNSTGVMTVLV